MDYTSQVGNRHLFAVMSGGEVSCIIIVYGKDYDRVKLLIEQTKNEHDEWLSDEIYNVLEKEGIKFLMPDFDEI